MNQRTRSHGRPQTPLTARGPIGASYLWAGLLCLLILAVFVTLEPVLRVEALCFDDPEFLTDNPLIRDPGWDSIERFFAEVFAPSTVRGYYIPLTMTSLAADAALGGSPEQLSPFHRTDLLLHLATTLLLALLLAELFGRRLFALLAALLFALHPVVIEPLAWIAERKTMLAGACSLLSLFCYARAVRGRGGAYWAGAWIAYLFALLAKPTSMPLPLLMLMLDVWPLRRLRWRALWEKTPFLLLMGASAVITLVSHARTADVALFASYTPGQALLLIAFKIAFYLQKLVWPAPLTPCYVPPHPLTPADPALAASVLVVLGLAAGALAAWRRTRAPLAALGFFVVALFPVLGTVQYSWVIVSDKYLYPLPLLAALLAAGALWVRFVPPRTRAREAAAAAGSRTGRRARVVGALVLLLLAAVAGWTSRAQLAYWRTTEALYEHMIAHAPEEALLYSNLALEYERQGRLPEAQRVLTEALRHDPDAARVHANLGAVLEKLGRPAEALEHFRAARAQSDEPAEIESSIANSLLSLGRAAEARTHLEEALRLDPRSAAAHTNLGRAQAMLGEREAALASFRRAAELDPLAYTAYGNIGGLLAQAGNHADAIEHYRKALSIEPRFAQGHSNLAYSLTQLGQLDEAAEHYARALQLRPDLYPAYVGLGAIRLAQGRAADAQRLFRQALQLRPGDAQAQAGWQRARAAQAPGQR